MKRWIAKVAAILAVSTVAIAATAAPAHAAWSDCPSSKFCVWIDANATGSMYYWGTEWVDSCVYIGPPFHDAVTSIKNNYGGWGYKVFVWTNVGCSGSVIQYSTWQGYFAPGNYKSLGCCFNDKASSFEVRRP